MLNQDMFLDEVKEYKELHLYKQAIWLVKEVLADAVKYEEEIHSRNLVLSWTKRIKVVTDTADEIGRRFYLNFEEK